MKVINAATIVKLIEAHIKGEEDKLREYANFIADSFDEAGESRSAKIIRSRIDGTYKRQNTVLLDGSEGVQDSSGINDTVRKITNSLAVTQDFSL